MIDFNAPTPPDHEDGKVRIGYDPTPEDYMEYTVQIPGHRVVYTINEAFLVRGEGEKNDQDEFWYNHLNGNGVLEIIAQVHACYGVLCEYRDTVFSTYNTERAFLAKKYKLNSSTRVSNDMFEVLLEINKKACEGYWTILAEKLRVERMVQRVEATIDLMNKVYEVARTRNANARALR